jgi:hypothetical protein
VQHYCCDWLPGRWPSWLKHARPRPQVSPDPRGWDLQHDQPLRVRAELSFSHCDRMLSCHTMLNSNTINPSVCVARGVECVMTAQHTGAVARDDSSATPSVRDAPLLPAAPAQPPPHSAPQLPQDMTRSRGMERPASAPLPPHAHTPGLAAGCWLLAHARLAGTRGARPRRCRPRPGTPAPT